MQTAGAEGEHNPGGLAEFGRKRKIPCDLHRRSAGMHSRKNGKPRLGSLTDFAIREHDVRTLKHAIAPPPGLCLGVPTGTVRTWSFAGLLAVQKFRCPRGARPCSSAC